MIIGVRRANNRSDPASLPVRPGVRRAGLPRLSPLLTPGQRRAGARCLSSCSLYPATLSTFCPRGGESPLQPTLFRSLRAWIRRRSTSLAIWASCFRWCMLNDSARS